MKPDTFDISRARKDTPACEKIQHFNNAGASLMPLPVTSALHEYLTSEAAIGGYETADLYANALNKLYTSAAKLLNCQTEEIAFVENATRAWDMAFYAFNFKPGDKILTAVAEYGSNVIAYLQQAKRFGVEVVFIPDDEYGQVDTNALSKMIDSKVKLISISHIPTGGGLVNPAIEIGRIARQHGIPYLLDACQSAGQIPLDLKAIGCDLLSITGRKYLRGPRGTGLLYVRNSILDRLDPPFLDQHAAELISPGEYRVRQDARKFENWEQFFAGKYALGVAIEYALSWGMETIRQRVYNLADKLRNELSNNKDITVTDQGREKCGIVTFTSQTRDAGRIKNMLAEKKINVSISDGSGT
ncbi:MAG: aminotransferase class V-fold PLP-dependent enzyme, partial [Gammaproteobacteria bacterium]|nr:aminotransferase class V-fold PLP-dependent enzyme [Gammaproteobacteria bacterium]